MKIGVVTPGFSAGDDDWCIPVQLNLVRRLSREVEVHVFTMRYPHHRRSYTVYDAVVHPQGGAETGGIGRIPILLRTLRSIVAEHHRRPFDVLHAMWADEPGFVAVTAGRLLKVPAIVSLLGGELVGFPDIGYGGQLSHINQWLIRFALHGAVCITAGSTYLRELARPHVNLERLQLMPLGVDTGLFHPACGENTPARLVEGDIKLLHVASLVPVKGQATLSRATALVVERVPGVHLHVVGDGPLLGSLRRMAQSLSIAGHVTFHGAVSHDCLPAYYRAADLCVLSSRYESQGMVTLEAAACGRTTVGTAVGLLPELVSQAHVVPVGNAPALAEAVLAVLEDRKRLATLNQAALAAVEARYTLQHTVAQLNDLYSEVAAGPRQD